VGEKNDMPSLSTGADRLQLLASSSSGGDDEPAVE
jgi:hypothetical protein